jgi:hypothetical protein
MQLNANRYQDYISARGTSEIASLSCDDGFGRLRCGNAA